MTRILSALDNSEDVVRIVCGEFANKLTRPVTFEPRKADVSNVVYRCMHMCLMYSCTPYLSRIDVDFLQTARNLGERISRLMTFRSKFIVMQIRRIKESGAILVPPYDP